MTGMPRAFGPPGDGCEDKCAKNPMVSPPAGLNPPLRTECYVRNACLPVP
jgi:hypothetical protein